MSLSSSGDSIEVSFQTMELWHHGMNPLPKTYHITRTLLQMEMKKFVDEVVKHMMNLIRELSQESTEEKLDEAPLTEEKVPTDEEMLEEQICEESYQEDPDEVSHVEDLRQDICIEEDEVVQP
jgi:hypothetical protein